MTKLEELGTAKGGKRQLSRRELEEELENVKRVNRNFYKFAVEELMTEVYQATEKNETWDANGYSFKNASLKRCEQSSEKNYVLVYENLRFRCLLNEYIGRRFPSELEYSMVNLPHIGKRRWESVFVLVRSGLAE